MQLLEPFLQWQDEIKGIRRDIHAHPELAYQELRTSDLVAKLLTEWGIEIDRGLGGTGVVGIVRGSREHDPNQALGLEPTWTPCPCRN